MSRKSFERAQVSRERWPNLSNLLACHFNEDVDILYGSLQGAFDHAARDGSIEHRQAVLREWRDWQIFEGAGDVRPSLKTMSVHFLFQSPDDARAFMAKLYDVLIEQVRHETGSRWKP